MEKAMDSEAKRFFAAHRSCPPGVQLLGAFGGGTLGLSAAWGAPGVAKWTMWAFVRLGEVGRGVSQRGLLDGGLGRSSSDPRHPRLVH